MIENAERVTYGEGCWFHPHAAIGGAAQHGTEWVEPSGCIIIGHRVRAFAFATVDLPLRADGETQIGDDCTLMHYSHVAHDCVLGRGVTLANSVQLAGHVHVHEGATLGLGAVVHQHVTVGAYAMVGMGSIIVDDVRPFATVVGHPGNVIGVNEVGMERAGFKEDDIDFFRANIWRDPKEILETTSCSERVIAALSSFVADRGRRYQ